MKRFISIILALLGVFIIKFSVNATDDFKNDISDRLFSSMDDDILDALEDFGITDIDFDSIYEISVSDIFRYYKENFSEVFAGSLKSFIKLFNLVILMGFITVVLESEKYKTMLSSLSVMAATLMITDSINLCLNSAISLIKLNGSLMSSFVPIYAVVIAASGNPSAALTYNSMILAFSEGISALISYGLIDVIGCFFCLSVAFSISDVLNFGRLISVTNKSVSFILGLSASLFASVLTLKSVISTAADTVAAKGVRFAIGSLIPVIGSSISEAYSVLIGSINVIKGSVAIVGIVAVLIINLPVLVEIMLYYFSFSALGFISETLDCKTLSNAFGGFSCGIKIIGLLAVFEMFVLIISTAVMLSFRGG